MVKWLSFAALLKLYSSDFTGADLLQKMQQNGIGGSTNI
jgi:hypothetical protein